MNRGNGYNQSPPGSPNGPRRPQQGNTQQQDKREYFSMLAKNHMFPYVISFFPELCDSEMPFEDMTREQLHDFRAHYRNGEKYLDWIEKTLFSPKGQMNQQHPQQMGPAQTGFFPQMNPQNQQNYRPPQFQGSMNGQGNMGGPNKQVVFRE